MVVAVDVHEAELLGQPEGVLLRLAQVSSMDDHVGTVSLAVLHLDKIQIEQNDNITQLKTRSPPYRWHGM